MPDVELRKKAVSDQLRYLAETLRDKPELGRGVAMALDMVADEWDDRTRSLLTAAAELDWWRNFATKFGPNNLPRVGDPLLGCRFRLMVDEPDGWQPVEGRQRG